MKLDTVRLDKTAIDSVDTLLVSGSDLAIPPTATAALGARVAQFIDRPRRLGSICTGAFILAKLGALDGHEVTTHWAFCSRFKRKYPNVIVKPDALFVTSSRIWTSAGVSAGIDMALAMIEQDMDHLAALKVARGMVLFLKRPGGQSQFSVELQRQMHDARGLFDELHSWIRANLDADLSVPALAEAARMSARNFARVYLRETGESPAEAVEKIRIEAAIRLLESAQDPIKVIASRTGFGDDERMRRAFIETYGVSPRTNAIAPVDFTPKASSSPGMLGAYSAGAKSNLPGWTMKNRHSVSDKLRCACTGCETENEPEERRPQPIKQDGTQDLFALRAQGDADADKYESTPYKPTAARRSDRLAKGSTRFAAKP